MYRELSIMNALPELIVLWRCWLRLEQRVQSMVRVSYSRYGTAEKAFICLFHQLDNVWHIRWTVVTALTSPYERIDWWSLERDVQRRTDISSVIRFLTFGQ